MYPALPNGNNADVGSTANSNSVSDGYDSDQEPVYPYELSPLSTQVKTQRRLFATCT
jgi:hypothetical protein